MDTPQSNVQPTDQGLLRADKLFIALLLGLTGLVAWVGYLSYQKGQKEETTKRNGEAWLRWLNDAAEHRHAPGFIPADCAAHKQPGTATWGNCYVSLAQPGGPLGSLTNPFSGSSVQRVAKCDPLDRKLAGALVFEKITATPPGSAIATISSALHDSDDIAQKLLIRLSVCDSTSDAIRIGEVTF